MKWWAAIVALGLLAGCSGGDDPQPAPTPSATVAPSGPAPEPVAAEPTGTPAPEALSSFRCEPAKKDLWVAAGFLANAGKKAATYQVSVYVGPLDGSERIVRTKQVANVAARGSVRFEINKIPAEGSACHVQVIRTDVG